MELGHQPPLLLSALCAMVVINPVYNGECPVQSQQQSTPSNSVKCRTARLQSAGNGHVAVDCGVIARPALLLDIRPTQPTAHWLFTSPDWGNYKQIPTPTRAQTNQQFPLWKLRCEHSCSLLSHATTDSWDESPSLAAFP